MQQQIAQAFSQRFDSKPALYFSPGRINLIGEHVDYNDGFVMPAAIDKGVWFAVAPNGGNSINCYSHDLKEVLEISYEDIQPQQGWQNYILGVLHVFLEKGLRIGGIDCVFGGNLPIGAGLSSSAAVECGLAFALNDLFNLGLSRKELALLAQRAEHLYPGVKCGIMDQYASLMGAEDNIIMLDCRSIEHQYIPFHLQDHALVLINTRVQHSLASGEYNVRRSQCAEGLAVIRQKHPKITSFRDISPGMIAAMKEEMDDTIYRRCSYVVNEIERTRLASEYLTTDRIADFGKLMYETHQGLSRDYEVSCAELDFLVDQARALGVTGARVMGGGFGGCTINLVEKQSMQEVVSRMARAYEDQFGITPGIIEVNVGNGVHRLS